MSAVMFVKTEIRVGVGIVSFNRPELMPEGAK